MSGYLNREPLTDSCRLISKNDKSMPGSITVWEQGICKMLPQQNTLQIIQTLNIYNPNA